MVHKPFKVGGGGSFPMPATPEAVPAPAFVPVAPPSSEESIPWPVDRPLEDGHKPFRLK